MSGVATAEQYDRSISLRVSSAKSTLDLSSLRIVFNIITGSASTARQLNVRIYNPAPSTVATVIQQYTQIDLAAGYNGNNGHLFSGQMQQRRAGRENPTDTFLDIFASDGYDVIANGMISQTLAAGWTPLDFYNEIIKAGAAWGLKAASVVPPSYPAGPRPLVMYGSIKAACDQLGKILGMRYLIDHGTLAYVVPAANDPQINTPPASMVPSNTGTAIVLTPATGLIGIPIQTLDGVEATCLLNSNIKRDSIVKIDQTLILSGKDDLSVQAQNAYPTIATDGLYYVRWTEHEGDTRGQPWYTHMVMEAVHGTGAVTSTAVEKAGFAGNE